MNRTVFLKGTLALALLPAAAGVTLAAVGPTSPAVKQRLSTTAAAAVSPARHLEPGDDRIARPAGKPTTMPMPAAALSSRTRAPEAGDDSGGHGGRTTATRAPEAGDDSGGHGARTTLNRAPEAGDDAGGDGRRTTVARASEPGDDSGTRAPEAGDDSGGHGARTTATRAPETGDDSGGHGGQASAGSGSRHGGSDDSAGHH